MSTPFYEQIERTSSINQPRTEAALSYARMIKPRRVLDMGSDQGINGAALAAATGAEVVCVDISEAAVRACRARGLEAHRVDIGDSDLPFEDESFDAVLMTEVIEHLVHPDKAIDEVRRVLRPRGYLILSTPNLACLPNRLLLPFGIQPLFTEVSEDQVLGRRLRLFGQGGKPVGHLRLYTKGALTEFLGLRGFRVVRARAVAMHEAGLLHYLESAASLRSTWGMILVVLAAKSA